MALEERNLAYDLSLFEEQPRKYKQEPKKKSNILELPKEKLKVNAKPKVNLFSILSTALLSFITVAVVVIMVYSQVQLTELTDNINSVKKTLNESQSVYTQLQMKVESNLSLRTVEEYARGEMLMRKIEPNQIDYVTLSSGDNGEVSNLENNFLFGLKDYFLALVS